MLLLDRYKRLLGKSKGRQSLYDHSLAVVDVALRIAQLVGEPRGPRLDRLVFAAFVHDVGKLEPGFQAMLEAAASKQPLPSRLVKHEACTFNGNYTLLVEEAKEAIRAELRGGEGTDNHLCSYELNLESLDERAMEHVWAFAVSHHGLFYVSYEEQDDGQVRPVVRRQWTCTSPREVRRMTLVDVLLEYYPLGGLVMLGDLTASYCHEQEKQYTEIFGRAKNLRELIDQLTDYAPAIEASLRQYDPRDYGIRELLTLLAGGL